MSTRLKTNFEVETKHEAFFTGGRVQITEDGSTLFCGCGNKVQALEISSGKVVSSFGQDQDEEITQFGLSPDDEVLVLATQNLLLRQWDWRHSTLTRTWKAIHTGPVSCMTFDGTTTLLVTGSSDSTIKVWDIVRKYCTHNLRGHIGVVRVVKFHPDGERLELYSGGEDNKIRVWDLTSSTCSHVLDTHYSVVTSLTFGNHGNTLLSSGRDSIIAVWSTTSYKLDKTIPVFETLESVFLLPEDKVLPSVGKSVAGLFAVTAGSKGLLRVWDIEKSKCVYSQDEAISNSRTEESDQEQIITQTLYNPSTASVTVVTYDHNILQFREEDFSLSKQFAGYNDEILDIQFLGSEDSHLAVVTNSNQVKVFELATWTCQILHGHTDIVLCLEVDKSCNIFVTSSKDNTIRLWKLDTSSGQVTCVAVGYGHTHAVGAVTFSRFESSFIVSGSQDCTLKVWSVPSTLGGQAMTSLHPRLTEKAHDKDINSVVVAPNDKLIASGSQDRTVKLWDAGSLKQLGVMRGHKRGVWCVQFSPVDQCLASASGDGTIKIWALSDFSCVKTFEGHDSSVLKVIFLSPGMQLLSSGSDGLMKLWTIKSNECVKTFDEHEDKVWALTVSKTETVAVTGGADSTIIIWKDVTQSELEDMKKSREEFMKKEQELCNLVHNKKFLKAVRLAIILDQPFRLLNVLKAILETANGQQELESTLSKLRTDQVDTVLRFLSKWNTNSRHCHVAQLVLSFILKCVPLEELSTLSNMKSVVEGLIPYTERHFERMKRLTQQSTFVEYTWQNMRAVAGTGGQEAELSSGMSGTGAIYIPNLSQPKTSSTVTQGQEEHKRPVDLARLIRDRVEELGNRNPYPYQKGETSQESLDESSGVTETESTNEELEKKKDRETIETKSEENTYDAENKPSRKDEEKKQAKKSVEKRKAKISDRIMPELCSQPKSKLRRLAKGQHLSLVESRQKFKIRKKNG